MNFSRRSLLGGFGLMIGMPAIVRASSIMPVKAWMWIDNPFYLGWDDTKDSGGDFAARIIRSTYLTEDDLRINADARNWNLRAVEMRPQGDPVVHRDGAVQPRMVPIAEARRKQYIEWGFLKEGEHVERLPLTGMTRPSRQEAIIERDYGFQKLRKQRLIVQRDADLDG